MSVPTRSRSAFLVVLVSALSTFPLAAQSDPRSRVSVSSTGTEGNHGSVGGAISRDGRHVAFYSGADNLVSGDVEGHGDVFVHDRQTGATVRLSVDANGVGGDYDSFDSALSTDGRFVAFSSLADNLVAGDQNVACDVFFVDRDPDGNGVFDEGNDVLTRVSEPTGGGDGDGWSFGPTVSSDGNLVAFSSDATNLVSGDTNQAADIFIRDRSAGTTTRVSVDSSGAQGDGSSFAPSLSTDGRWVAFQSTSTNLVAGDTNGCNDIFVHDLTTGATVRASVNTSGVQGNLASTVPSISGDGSRVVFSSEADNFSGIDLKGGSSDIFLHDFVAGTTRLMSVDSTGAAANGPSYPAVISEDGKTVAFASSATNLSANDNDGTYDVFVRDLNVHTTTIISQTAWLASTQGSPASLSGDGNFVVFGSDQPNLVPDDLNADYDVFVYDRSIPEPTAASVPYGAGYPGTLGIPNLAASAAPVFGTSVSATIGNSLGRSTAALLAVGSARASIPTRAGGTLNVAAPNFFVLTIPAGGLTIPWTVPLSPALCGLQMDLQVLELDAGAQYGISFTPGLEWIVGN